MSVYSELAQALYDLAPMTLDSYHMSLTDDGAVLGWGPIELARFDSDRNVVHISHGGQGSNEFMKVLNAVVERFGCKITRTGATWKINDVQWDGTPLCIPNDIENMDWITKTIGLDLGMIVDRVKQGELIRGTRDTLKVVATASRGVLVDVGDEYVVGTSKALLGSLYLAHSIAGQFLIQHWVTQFEEIRKWYGLNLVVRNATPITLDSKGAILCKLQGEHINISLLPEYQLNELLEMAHSN